LHRAFYNEFLLKLAILVPEINISRTTTLEFQDFSRVFQDLCLFQGLSRPGNLKILIPGLSRTLQGLYEPCVCGRGICDNSIHCTSCQKWVHRKCSGTKGARTKWWRHLFAEFAWIH